MSYKKYRTTLNDSDFINQYSIIKLIGQGGYGDIYKVFDTQNIMKCAMKVEEIDCEKQALQHEIDVLRNLHSQYFPQYIDSGKTLMYRYLVQDLYGPSFSSIRKYLPQHSFSASTVLRIGIEMLKAIKKLHQRGYIHRDIKPSNFLLRPSRKHPLVLIDFGLTLQFIDSDTNEEIEPRADPGFFGTVKYCSPNAHLGKELGRRDDLYSWFYSLIEMRAGSLPWSSKTCRDDVLSEKLMLDLTSLTKYFPKQIISVYRIIRRLSRGEEPNYNLIMSFMVDAMKTCGAKWDDKFEWEFIDLSAISQIPIRYPSWDRMKVPKDLPRPIFPGTSGVTYYSSKNVNSSATYSYHNHGYHNTSYVESFE